MKKHDYIIIASSFLLLLLVYIGFYYPDERYNNIVSAKYLLIAIRVLFPVFIITVISLYILVKTGRINKTNLLVSIISSIITLILILVISMSYYTISKKKHSAFHPFLQLMPNKINTEELGDKNLFRIVCLGGSTTEFKDDYGIGWPEYLEKKLKEDYGIKNVRVFNCGKQWYSSLHMLIHYETNIRPFQPDVIIVMEAINDLLLNADQSYFSAGPLRNDYGHFYGPVNRIAKGKGFFDDIFVDKIFKFWYQKPRKELDLFQFPGIDSYKSNINTIIDLAFLDKTQVILMTQPTLLKQNLSEEEHAILQMVNLETVGENTKWSHESAWRGMKLYNDTIKEIALNRKTELIDLDNSIPKNNSYFYDDVHYRDKAYPLIVEIISQALVRNSIITGQPE